MRVPIFQVDAFTTQRFKGNPAAVMIMQEYLDDSILQAIAAENNLAETAFIVAENGDYHIRWFTPTIEVPLCGHATLASAAVVMDRLEPNRQQTVFHSKSGPLKVKRAEPGYMMDFPAHRVEAIETPVGLLESLGAIPISVSTYASNYLVMLKSAAIVRDFVPDFAAISQLKNAGVVITARGDAGYDFVSRYFAPNKGIPEDPVTGGAHCALVPYWSSLLDKYEFLAYQASPRGGEIVCRLAGNRVEMEGSCVFYLEGEAEI